MINSGDCQHNTMTTRRSGGGVSIWFSAASRYVKHKTGFAVKGGAGQVQGAPCRGSRAAQALAGRDGAKTCALVKKRAGAAEQVPQKRPYRFVALAASWKAMFAENSRPESSERSRIGQKKRTQILLPRTKEATVAI